MDNVQNITVLIGGRPYPLRIKEGDAPAINRIVKEVNDKIALFQNTYPRKDRQDWMAMTLLTYAVDLHKEQSVPASMPDPHISEKLAQIDALLSSLLS